MSEGVSPSPGGTRPGFSINTHNLIGGLIVTVLALFMLGYALYVPNTVIPRLMLAALAVIGIAAAVGLVPVHGPRDFYGGIALVMMPALALVALMKAVWRAMYFCCRSYAAFCSERRFALSAR